MVFYRSLSDSKSPQVSKTLLCVFHWSLNDSKSPQVSRTLLSILAVLNNAVVWMVSTRPPTSKSSRPFYNPLVTVPKAPITIGTITTHSFFNSLARSRYLSFFSHSFSFILWSAGTAKSTILQILFFVDYYKVWSSGRDIIIIQVFVNFLALLYFYSVLCWNRMILEMANSFIFFN